MNCQTFATLINGATRAGELSHLFLLPNFPEAMFMQGGMFILDSRVFRMQTRHSEFILGGGRRDGNFCLISVLKICLRREERGSKKPKNVLT